MAMRLLNNVLKIFGHHHFLKVVFTSMLFFYEPRTPCNLTYFLPPGITGLRLPRLTPGTHPNSRQLPYPEPRSGVGQFLTQNDWLTKRPGDEVTRLGTQI